MSFNMLSLNKNKIFFSILLVFVGFLFIFLVPPFQKPDEANHYYRMITIVSWIRDFPKNSEPRMYVDEYSLPEKSFSGIIAGSYVNKFPISIYRSLLFKKNSFITKEEKISVDWKNFFSYTPGIVGYLFLGSYFPFVGFYIARFSFFLFFIVCLWWSLKNTQGRFKYLIYLYCCIPMVWQQVTAISYDAVLLSLVLVVYTLSLKFLKSKEISWKNFIVFLLALICVSLSKPGNEIFMFLILIFPFKKIFSNISKIKLFLLNFLLFLFCSVFFIFMTFKTGLVSTDININQLIQKQLLVSDPTYVLTTILNTLKVETDFYIGSFLGNFGWLDYHLSWPIYLLILIVLVLIYINYFKKDKKPILSYGQIFLIFGFVILNLGTIFGSMYLIWTSGASDVILGVQGRYFLPLLLFFLLAVSELFLNIGVEKVKQFLFKISLFVIFISISIATYNRYYNYSRVYRNPEELKGKYELLEKKDLENVILDKEIVVEIPIKGKKFSAFQFISNIPKGKKVLVPYIYSISDINGKIIQKGYIPVADIVDGVSQKSFGIKELNTDKVILSIKPFLQDEKQEYISLVKEKKSNEYLINLLYISD